ncbi:MAG: hypothetical protein Q9196_007384 [Gyalolechia fulgens]
MRIESNQSAKDGKRVVVGASDPASKRTGPYRPRSSSPPSYHPNAPPFDFFTRHKIGPLDSDPDIVWQLEQGTYRAYRLSTLKHDPMVKPALINAKNTKEVVIRAKNWLAELRRRATGNPKAEWDDQMSQSCPQENSVHAVRAGQPVNTASQNYPAKQPLGHLSNSVQRLDQQRGQQRRAVRGAAAATRIDDNMTLDQNGFPYDSTHKRKRKSSDEQTAPTEPKRTRVSPETQHKLQPKPEQRLPPRANISTPKPETAMDLNHSQSLVQHVKPQHADTITQQAAPRSSQEYFADQSSLVARSFSQPRFSGSYDGEQNSFTALLGADAYSTPADWGSM